MTKLIDLINNLSRLRNDVIWGTWLKNNTFLSSPISSEFIKLNSDLTRQLHMSEMSTYYVYILECSDKTFYTGRTNNIEKRIQEHNKGTCGAKYTRARRPIKLVYVETYPTLSDALKRELQIKKLSHEQKLRFTKKT